MAQASEEGEGDFSVRPEDMSPEQLAAIATLGAILTGGVFSTIGLQMNMDRYSAAIAITAMLLAILLGVVFALMRAMVISAKRDDGNPMHALTNPLFIVLFLLVAIGVAVFVGVYTWINAGAPL